MELDDLKNAWKQEDKKETKTPHIMEMIHQKSRGPLASLKTAFRKQMALVTAFMCIVIATQTRNLDNTGANLLFFTFIGFCLAMIAAFRYNYLLTKKMESMQEQVKTNLEHHVATLQQRLKWQNIGARIVILFLILLLEVIPHYQDIRMLNKWHALSPLIRFSGYAAYLLFQYFLSRAVTQRKFGRHLDRLKGLLRETE